MRVYAYKQKRKLERFTKLRNESEKLIKNARNIHDFDSLIYSAYTYPDFQPAQKNSEIKKLMELASTPTVKTICEIGTYKGGSLFLLAQAAASDALLISVDIEYKDGRKRVYPKFAKPGQRLKCIKGDTHEPSTIERIGRILRGRKIDLLFIDGDHSFFGVMNDYIRFSPMVSEGGVIVFHDVQMDSKMRDGVKSESDVGSVPIFWDALKRSGEKTDEFIEDTDQDGYGLGIVYR
jgi:predicted O-methyltransferase YrrM